MAKFADKVNILNTIYTIVVKNECDDERLKNSTSAYCNYYKRQIVVCNGKSLPDAYNEYDEASVDAYEKVNLRHEIVHAFLHESGLSFNSLPCSCWAKNEEMVDWFAFQSPKLFDAFMQAGAI